ncbi:cytochrome C oxidase subunit IV family protein [Planctomicrobium piriforme]|uniref:Cytochrome c oxidase subunit 4 n=1 Tax=Planctomicrobium piriforme TaxID=1576369 RepID=A0A1I3JGK8_9PLAN|nr:cytochrome C oxidase subunit IV family protein [Planctomicrobium piriforme]SFI59098.1 cytochrome c oxidase subunit 4 [Planctomicrobium piriforme]
MAHHSHVKVYLTVYFTLLVLVLFTVLVSLVPTGILAFPIAMAIASFKALLIVLIFMHVKDETPLVRVFAFVGVVWLGIMFAFTMADYATRGNTSALSVRQIEALEPGVPQTGGHGAPHGDGHGSTDHAAPAAPAH